MRANEIFTSPLEKHKVRLSRESTLSVYISFLTSNCKVYL